MKKINTLLLYLRLIFTGSSSRYLIYKKYLGVNFSGKARLYNFVHFGSEPYLISIGDNAIIAMGVTFITHDGSAGLFRKEYPGLNCYKEINVGNNVFIGINSIILPGVTIGNNVIIGAGSIVNKDIPDNVVVAGVPAKIIKSIDEYKENLLKDACIIDSIDREERKKIILTHIKNKK